ncbi:hypothetical protein MUN77_03465 [Leucobacter allii]|uniref:hypothetical protein n=1 Tax=Leucobacter allii TaxID=2932247 RepID=UPI001FD3F5C0|nr:hypothetical protein [Leucobacter allii]UOR02387.1 hypothetical protein MUN77_03465 [Leucobacter allii]
MASEKTQVIEWIFLNRKHDAATGALRDPIVTMDDVAEAIAATNAKLSTGNLANFWKDLTRDGAKGLNRNWPPSVFAYGYAGGDAIGQGDRAVFMFVPVDPGQAEPFVDELPFEEETQAIRLQSLSMPQAMKALGRPGENWHAQVADRLNVVSSFFALCSPRNVPPLSVHEVNFLQTGIKMKDGETDAAFSLMANDGQWLVSAEVKGNNEQFHLPQIARAAHALETTVKSAKSSTLGDVVGVIPLGIKVVGRSKLWVVEFAPVESPGTPLAKVAEGVFELVPHVPGID